MTDSTPTADQIAHSAAYRGVRERVTELVSAAPPETLEAIAPATPDWRLRDILAHVVGVATDVVHGNVADAGTDPWTAVQVDARRDTPVDALLDEWATSGRQVDAFVLALPTEITGQLIADTVTHEHDLRHALGVPGARDSDAVALGVRWAIDVLGRMYDVAGESAVAFETDLLQRTSGSGSPGPTVRTSAFELARAATGRRTLAEIGAYDWAPAAQPERLLLQPVFAARAQPLGE